MKVGQQTGGPTPEAVLVLPNQLFETHPCFRHGRPIYLVEDRHFFFDPLMGLKFHKKKLVLHRASMSAYCARLEERGLPVHYVECAEACDRQAFFARLGNSGVRRLHLADPVDGPLEEALLREARSSGIDLAIAPTPMFLTQDAWFRDFFAGARHYSLTSFYIAQRKRMDILLHKGKPLGGRWTYDTANRKALPQDIRVPDAPHLPVNPALAEAKSYVDGHFPAHPGMTEGFAYPVTHADALSLLEDFCRNRLPYFGDYQDAMQSEQVFLFHSVLSPALNTGLLVPDEVLKIVLNAHEGNRDAVPLNAVEGFVRQVAGWREFMRAVYVLKGEQERSMNFWNHTRPLPATIYAAKTGMEPLDGIIRRVLQHAYTHHIERLMVLGNFMLLCETDPNDVYRWFMEMFIDAYDWVMVPNVFGMSQYADGGLITTKPYVSSSRYILKMSDFPTGNWREIWDGLYWRFIVRHRDFFRKNPRMAVMVKQLERMDSVRLSARMKKADAYLEGLR